VRLLVVGASGHLGGEVCRLAVAGGGWDEVVGAYHREAGDRPGVRWEQLDIRDGAAVDGLMRTVRPTVVVSAANRLGDWVAIADGAAHVARAAASARARLVHVSSDAIHSGRPEPYGDAEPPTPITEYGAAKAAAETAVRALDPSAAVVRCSLILGDETSVQVRLCADLVAGRVAGALFTDEIRCPVADVDLAAAVLELATSEHRGPINVTGPEALSRADLGRLIARRYGLDGRLPVSTMAESGIPPRPREVRLDTSLVRSLLQTRLRSASEVLTVTVRS
jgi:dTDP-4-dehydrorhamnose reductase